MSNKSHEIGVYVDDIPMRLSERYRPLDVSAYTDDQTVIPDLFDQHYKFNAELYALEVFEFRDRQRRHQLSDSVSKINLKSDDKPQDRTQEPELNRRGSLSKDGLKSENRRVNSIHLDPGEILKPLPKMSDNYNISDNSIDPNVNIKRKIVKDFESDTSSPFDYVELQTIDDMQELNDVFQAFQSKSQTNKQLVNENHIKSNTVFSESNNRLNQINCEQNLPFVQNMNGINFTSYGYQTSNSSTVNPQNMSVSGQAFNSNNWLSSTSGYRNSDNTTNTTDSVNYNSIGCHSLADSHNNLRSSKSVSDLPTLVNSEESASNSIRRQRSHTPPCSAVTKSKTKKYLNVKQSLVLNDPYEELSQNSKELVDSISSMGFDRSRVARAVKHMDNDHKQVIDFLLLIQTLEESGYDSCEAEIALHMNSHQIPEAKKFLESLRQLSEVGFDKKDIIKALVKCSNDRDRALDILLNTENAE